jgi:hypothetical protein
MNSSSVPVKGGSFVAATTELHRQKLWDLPAEYADAVDPRELTCRSLESLEPSMKIAQTSASNFSRHQDLHKSAFLLSWHHTTLQLSVYGG